MFKRLTGATNPPIEEMPPFLRDFADATGPFHLQSDSCYGRH